MDLIEAGQVFGQLAPGRDGILGLLIGRKAREAKSRQHKSLVFLGNLGAQCGGAGGTARETGSGQVCFNEVEFAVAEFKPGRGNSPSAASRPNWRNF